MPQVNHRLVRYLGAAATIIVADYLFVLTDCIIAGRMLGEMALGAMNLLMPVFSVVAFFIWLLASGTATVFSSVWARGDQVRAAGLAGQGLAASALLGLLLVGGTTALEGPYLAFMCPSEAVTDFSSQYWRWYPCSIMLQSMLMMLLYLVFVRGWELACIRSYVLAIAVNVVVSYGLCRRFGLAGVSLGSIVAYVCGIAALTPCLLASFPKVRLGLRFDPSALARALKLSFSESFFWLFQAVLFVAITKYVLAFWDSESLAVCAVVFCIIRLTTFFGGIGVALQPLARTGRGEEGKSLALSRMFRLGAGAAFAAMLFAAMLFFIAPELVIGLFGIESTDLVLGAVRAARITVAGLVICASVAFVPLSRRVKHSNVPEARLNYLQDYVLERQADSSSSQMFNLAKLFRVRKGVDLERLADALIASARSHQALLTVLRRDAGGAAVQRMELAPEALQCPVVKADETELLANKSALVKTFDTFGGCLLEAKIFDCGERAYLLSDFHHLICDGYSFPLILEDAHRVWNGETLASDAYYNVLARREERSMSPVVVAGRNFLRELVKSKPFTTLPPDDFHGPSGYGTLECPLTLPADFAAFLSTHRVTRHHVFLAATVRALALMTGAEDLLVDWVFHGRMTKDELRTVGAFMVDLPLILERISSLTAADVLSQVKQETFRGIKNANSPRNVGDLNPLGQDRLTFIYQDEWGELMSPGPVREDGPYAWMIEETIPLTAPSAATENPFNVEIMEHRDATRLFLEYDAGRYSEATVRRYAKLFSESLDWLLA